MNKGKAFEFFGGPRAVAELLDISTSAVHQWKSTVPLYSALQLERLSDGELAVDISAYESSGRAINRSRESV